MESSNTNRVSLSQSGFTLIEMMVIVAIISILAAISMASYQTHVRKTQVMTIYQEINSFRTPYQMLMNEGSGVTDFSPAGLNLAGSSKYCEFGVTEPSPAGVTLEAVCCDIHGLSYLQDQYISLDYDSKGSWQCRASADVLTVYLPSACQ